MQGTSFVWCAFAFITKPRLAARIIANRVSISLIDINLKTCAFIQKCDYSKSINDFWYYLNLFLISLYKYNQHHKIIYVALSIFSLSSSQLSSRTCNSELILVSLLEVDAISASGVFV